MALAPFINVSGSAVGIREGLNALASTDDEKGSALIGHRQVIGSAAYLSITSDMINGVPVSVMTAIDRSRHAAIYAGTSTDDLTTEVQDIVSEAPDGCSLVFPRGNFRIGNVQIADKTGFKLIGAGARIDLIGDGSAIGGSGFEMFGTLTSLTVEGLRIVGEGDKAKVQKGVWSRSGVTIEDLTIRNMRIENVVNGISVNANLSGSVDGFSVTDISLKNMVGIASSEGYGVHFAFLNAGSMRGMVSRVRGVNVGRHLIYCARASNVDISDIQSFNHRGAITSGESADATDGWGKLRPAILIARSSNIRLSRVRAWGGYDGAVMVANNPNAEAGVQCYDIGLSDLNLGNQQDSLPLLIIGESGSQATVGAPEDVTVEQVRCWSDFDGRAGSDAIRHYCGQRVTYRDIDIRISNATGTTSGIDLRNEGESGGSSTYNQDVVFDDVTLSVQSSGSVRGIAMHSTALADSNARITLKNIRGVGALSGVPITETVTRTNSEIRNYQENGEVVGGYAAGSTTIDVSRGVTVVFVTNSSATSVSAINGAVGGQKVKFIFTDANTTFVYSSTMRTPGEQNMVSRNRLCVEATYSAALGQWFFDSPPYTQRVTTAALASAANAVNTSGKLAGKTVVVDTGSVDQLWTARGSSATAIWSLADGSSTVTPA